MPAAATATHTAADVYGDIIAARRRLATPDPEHTARELAWWNGEHTPVTTGQVAADADVAERPRGNGTGRADASRQARKANRYAAACVRCGGRVEADAGYLAKDAAGRWAAEHIGTCPEAPAAAEAPAAPTRRPNQYDGPCVRCGQLVPAGAGYLAKTDRGKWAAEHVGTCPTVPEAKAQVAAAMPEVPEGHYAIPSTTPGQDYTFLRVDHGTGEWAGRVFVKYVIGGRPDTNAPANAVANLLARILAVGVAQAATTYCAELERCARCNRHLTKEQSRVRGMGADCAEKAPW